MQRRSSQLKTKLMGKPEKKLGLPGFEPRPLQYRRVLRMLFKANQSVGLSAISQSFFNVFSDSTPSMDS